MKEVSQARKQYSRFHTHIHTQYDVDVDVDVSMSMSTLMSMLMLREEEVDAIEEEGSKCAKELSTPPLFHQPTHQPTSVHRSISVLLVVERLVMMMMMESIGGL
jgi:hypothetical protein